MFNGKEFTTIRRSAIAAMLLALSSYSLLGYMAIFSHQAVADPEADRQAMRTFYQKRFPDVAPEAHKDGVYAFDENAREQWLELEDFPPYEIAIMKDRNYSQPHLPTAAITATVLEMVQ